MMTAERVSAGKRESSSRVDTMVASKPRLRKREKKRFTPPMEAAPRVSPW